MKPLFKVAFAALLFFVFTSFISAKNHASAQRGQKDQYYYWYLDNGTVYDDWTSVSNEITRLEDEYGVFIDEDPVNGTLIASGYFVKAYPHPVYPSVLLYSH